MHNSLLEIMWLRQLLSDLGFSQHEPIRLFCDSQTALNIVDNPVFHERTKHFEFDCHAVCYLFRMEEFLQFMFGRKISSQIY